MEVLLLLAVVVWNSSRSRGWRLSIRGASTSCRGENGGITSTVVGF
jgi:hypothetical protein